MARIEIVTGRERRRRWSEENKLQILQEAATSGLSVADVARRHDVVPQQIYIWRRQLLAKARVDAGVQGTPPRFLPVAVIGETEAPEVPQGERIAEKPRGTARQGADRDPLQRWAGPEGRGGAGSGSAAGADPLGGGGMIGPGANARVYLACGVTDMRKGIDGLAALVQSGLRQKPTSGAVFAFRGRRGDRIKLLTWDGQGFCLYYKVLEKGRFPWPSSADGTARLTSAQLAMLWEGIDWRRPSWSSPPMRTA